jgi:hypothetical protein|tara:strand:+ start:373 stop:2007 length:1635 start_codon:yes stop_codon:yes gene_type:complete
MSEETIDLYSQGYVNMGMGAPRGDSTCRTFDDKNDKSGQEHPSSGEKYLIMRHRKGRPATKGAFGETYSKADYRYWHVDTKVNADGEYDYEGPNCIRYTTADDGDHPCLGLGESILIHDQPGDFKSGADHGYRCRVTKAKMDELVGQLADGTISEEMYSRLMSASHETISDGRVTFLDQYVWGATTASSGRQSGGGEENGVCNFIENIDKVILKRDGQSDKTCWHYIRDKHSEAFSKRFGLEFCALNPTDIRCSCVNATKQLYNPDDPSGPILNFLESCELPGRRDLPGCDRILAKRKEMEAVLCPKNPITGLASLDYNGDPVECPASKTYGGNADCLAPGICDGAVIGQDGSYQFFPENLPGPCATNINICNQLMIVDDLSTIGDASINMSCDIDVQTIQDNRDAIEAAIKAAEAADEAAGAAEQDWLENQYALEGERAQQIVDDKEDADEWRENLMDAQTADRNADRELGAQITASAFGNVLKRQQERAERDAKFRSEEAQREFEKNQYESSKIGGMDPKTLTFVAVGLFFLIFLIIFATKI